jgi:AcrR family transcriptional regulator
MPSKPSRSYCSPVRDKQAALTRDRVLTAAQALFETKGYDATGIAAIAKKAKVSEPTVFAVFGSKEKILQALLDRTLYGPEHDGITERVRSIDDPVERLKAVAAIARQVNDAEKSVNTLFQGLSAISSEMATLHRDGEARRYVKQEKIIGYAFDAGRIRRGLSQSEARDILWTLTSREVYRKLVLERGWASSRYEAWLADSIESALAK